MQMKMTKHQNVAVIISALLFAVLLPLLFLDKSFSRPITAVLLVLSAILVSRLTKRRIPPSVNKRTVALILAVLSVAYISLFYLTGLAFGLYKNPYVSTVISSLSATIPITISIIAIEITRKNAIAQQSRLAEMLMIVSGVIFDVIISTSATKVLTFYDFMDLFGLTLLPALSANVFYNYIAKRYGSLPTVLYRLPLALYVYLFTNVPAMPDALSSFISVILPLIALWFISLLFEKKKKNATNPPNRFRFVGIGAISILMISVVMLISCQFRFGLIVIATDSMTGEINKGDAIVYDTDVYESIEVGDVIVFEKDNVLIVHRVIKIESINGQKRYYTKGDANNVQDEGYITSLSIVGTTKFKIAYIGYPSLWIREIFNNSTRGA